MKSFPLSILLTGIFLILFLGSLYAQDSTKTNNEKKTLEHNQHFTDEDGDGYNDNAPDHDGDGIPNGLDPDWQKSKEQKRSRQRFVDLDGDGINDNLQPGDELENEQDQNLHGQKKGSSLDNKSREEQQKQQRKQRGKP